MSNDKRDTIEVLKAELNFVEKGGYGRSVKTPWQPISIFQDSTSCLNFAEPEKTHPCNECLLIDFVPAGARSEEVPCHHIPLNASGITIDDLEWKENEHETAETVENWLRSTIARLEQKRAASETQ